MKTENSTEIMDEAQPFLRVGLEGSMQRISSESDSGACESGDSSCGSGAGECAHVPETPRTE